MRAVFALACVFGAILAQARHHHKHHHEHHHEPERQGEMETKPQNNLWDAYWADNSQESNSIAKFAKCQSCALSMMGLQKMLKNNFVHSSILSLASFACELSGNLGHRFSVCPMLVRQFGEPMFTVVEDYLVTKDRVCNEALGWCSDPIITEIDLDTVVDNILATKPVELQNDDYIQNLYDQMAKSTEPRPTLKALHVSDIHIDFEYTPGSLSNCKDYLCCHADSGFPKKDTDIAAGEWGSNNCDIPIKTYQSMLQDVVENNLPDLVFWTGDNASHEVWKNTADETVIYTVTATQLMQQAFEGKNITVLPTQGNHDTWVEEIESFAAPGINYEINGFKRYWKQWLTDEAYEKFGEYGYYSQPIELLNGKSLPKATRVIALNTQACNSLNWYIWGQREDPGHMFAWLEQELLDAEAEGGLAFIISHYTPNQCQHQFGSRYRALMERFQSTIRFTLHGHTHTTYYEVVQSYSNPGTPLMLANVAGSVTTYSVQNPSYMIIELDQETMLPVNMYSYALDIERANAEGHPTWELIHDYKEAYGMTDLSPWSMKALSERFLSDADVAAEFTWNQHAQRGSKPTEVDQKGLYCLTSSSEMWEQHECLNTELDGLRSKHGLGFGMWTLQGAVDRLVGSWIDVSFQN